MKISTWISFLMFSYLPLSIFGAEIKIENNKGCWLEEIYVCLPIDSFANTFILDTILIEDDKSLRLENIKPIAICLYIPALDIDYTIYVHPSDRIELMFDVNCNLNIKSLYIDDIHKLSNYIGKKVQYYLDFFETTKALDSMQVYEIFTKEKKKINSELYITSSDLKECYVNDLLFTLLGSLFRDYTLRIKDPSLIKKVITDFNLDKSVNNLNSNYSYYYYTSFNNDNTIDLQSEYFQAHRFLFSIHNVQAKEFMLVLQFVMGVKSNVPTLINDLCLAYSDIKQFIGISPEMSRVIDKFSAQCFKSNH